MQKILVDAGPLIALFNNKDNYHKKIIEFLKKTKYVLITTWPVITEVSHMLDFSVSAQIDFLSFIRTGGLKIEDINLDEVERIITLTKKYSDIPMDLADASLVVLSERLHIKKIITIDSDYQIYRTIKKERIKNIFGD